MSILDFLTQLRIDINNFTKDVVTQENKTTTDRRFYILKYELAMMYYTIIEFYFRDINIPDDDNIMTQEELQTVIDKLNNIMGTDLYTDFS